MRTLLRMGVVAIGVVPIAAIWTAFAAAPDGNAASDNKAATAAGTPANSTAQTAAPGGQNAPRPAASAPAAAPQPAKASATAPALVPPRDGAATDHRSALVPDRSATAPAPQAIRFQFRSEPWKNVLEWFAKQAGYSLQMDSAPEGTFNYSDTREYTPSEAIDLLNTVLSTKGYTLLRKARLLIVANLENPIHPYMIENVSPQDLDKWGEFELVHVLFNLDKFKPEEAEAEAKKLLGPAGQAVALTKTRQLSVTDTAGRCRQIREMINRIEDPASSSANFKMFYIKYAHTDDVLTVLRQLLDIPEDKLATADGSLRIGIDPHGGRLLFLYGKESDKIARAAEIIKDLDQAPRGPITIKMDPQEAQEAIARIQKLWPALRENQLQIIAPAEAAPGDGDLDRPLPGFPPRVVPQSRPLLERPGASPSKSVPLRRPLDRIRAANLPSPFGRGAGGEGW